MENKTERILFIAWFRESDYPRILSIFKDAGKLPRTFKEWLIKAEAAEKKYSDSGVRVFRAIIDPDTFPTWCRANNLEVNAEARRKFCVHKSGEMATGQNN